MVVLEMRLILVEGVKEEIKATAGKR